MNTSDQGSTSAVGYGATQRQHVMLLQPAPHSLAAEARSSNRVQHPGLCVSVPAARPVPANP